MRERRLFEEKSEQWRERWPCGRNSSEGTSTSARAHRHGLLYVRRSASSHIDNAFDIVSRLILRAPRRALAGLVGGITIGGWIRSQQDLLVEALEFDGQILAIKCVLENLA